MLTDDFASGPRRYVAGALTVPGVDFPFAESTGPADDNEMENGRRERSKNIGRGLVPRNGDADFKL